MVFASELYAEKLGELKPKGVGGEKTSLGRRLYFTITPTVRRLYWKRLWIRRGTN